MDEERLAKVRSITNELNDDGMRVIAVAIREFEPLRETYSLADESDLVLVGYTAFLDPPKETVAPALKDHGIDVKILTGDNERVTSKVCRAVGLSISMPVLGAETEAMDDATLARTVEINTVFARLTPAHKERIVRVLRNHGHVVGFLGDGINDAAALRTADIGISVDHFTLGRWPVLHTRQKKDKGGDMPSIKPCCHEAVANLIRNYSYRT